MSRSPSATASFAERILAPIDQLRSRILKALSPAIIPVVRRRELRVLLAGTVTIAMAAALTLGMPWWLLALGPIVWGVPHLVADLRYLVIRPGLHRRPELCWAAGLPLAVAGCGFWSVPVGLTGAIAVAIVARGSHARKALAILTLLPLVAASAWAPALSQLVFAHLHNFIAVMLWWAWRPRSHAITSAVPLLFVAVSLAIGLGWLQAAGPGSWLAPTGLEPTAHWAWLAPGVAAPWAERLVLLFAFAQTVHYGVWLRLIPEDDRPQATPRTFAASFRALRSDMGSCFLAGAAALALGLAAWAVFDLFTARASYLRMALFHGYLEVAAAVLLWIEGRPAR